MKCTVSSDHGDPDPEKRLGILRDSGEPRLGIVACPQEESGNLAGQPGAGCLGERRALKHRQGGDRLAMDLLGEEDRDHPEDELLDR